MLSTPGLSLNCKFFGALTYTVNLNLYKTTQEKINIIQVLNRLLIHLSTSISELRYDGVQNLFIIKKLFSNLSLIFNSYKLQDVEWINPLKPLVFMLISNQPPSIDQLNIEVNLMQLVELSYKDKTPIRLVLEFSSVLVEDLLKIGKDAEKGIIHEYIHSNVYEITKHLTVFTFESHDDDLILLGLENLSSWILYISFAHNNTAVRYKDLNNLLQYVVGLLQSPNEEISDKCSEIATEIFENDPLLMNYELRERFNSLIMSPWSLSKINEYVTNEDFDSLSNFASLIITFLEIDCIQLSSKLMKNEWNEFLKFLLNLTNFPLTPIIQETVSLKFIGFWCQIIEVFTDEMDMIENALNNDSGIIDEVNKNFEILLQELSMIYFRKIQLTVTSDSEFKQNRDAFLSFRGDTVEIFEMIHSKLASLFGTLISLILESSDINQIEASLYILTAICVNFTNNYEDDSTVIGVKHLFESNFLSKFNELTSKMPHSQAELYVKTSIRFLGSLEFFYTKNNTVYLNSVIDYLFTCLKNHPEQEILISKTIMELCDNCRSLLVSSIPNFEPILVEMIRNPSINNYTREKFINSISCIIQSIPDPEAQENHVYHILELIEKTSEPALQKASQESLGKDESEYLISLFNSLHELGKGLSLPDDFEEDEPQLYNQFCTFYKNSNNRIQDKLVRLVNLFAIEIPSLAKNLEVNEKACLIFKVGLLEEFGPFAFTNNVVLQFALSKKSQGISFQIRTYLLELLTTLINTGLHSKVDSSNILSQDDVTNIVEHFIVQDYQKISEDPDLLQLALNMLTQVLVHKPAFLLHNENSIRFSIETALSLLYSHEKFVIKAASKFWTTFLSARKTTRDDSLLIQQIVESELGQTLTFKTFEALIDAARSDVDTYSSIIVILFAKYQLKFKDWLRNALIQIDEQRISNGKKPIHEKELFVKKLMVTRASTRKCNELIKDFWITTNGLVSFTN